MKVTEVYPRLFIRGKFFKTPTQEKLDSLHLKGISVVVNLIRKNDPDLEAAEEIQYIHLPLSDGKNIDREAVEELTSLVVAHIRMEHGVLVHCNAGRNRSGLICALAISRLAGVDTAVALEMLRVTRPNAVGSNPVFERLLLGTP